MSLQCYISREAADAIGIETIRIRARERGVERATLEYSYYRTGGRCRITCRPAVAEVVVEELQRAIETAVEQSTRDACELAMNVVCAAIAHSYGYTPAPRSEMGG